MKSRDRDLADSRFGEKTRKGGVSVHSALEVRKITLPYCRAVRTNMSWSMQRQLLSVMIEPNTLSSHITGYELNGKASKSILMFGLQIPNELVSTPGAR